MKEYHIDPSPCTACGSISDMASAMGDARRGPEPGDVTMCLKCGHIMVYGNNMQLRDPTPEEMYSIAADPAVIAAQKVRKKVLN